MSSGRGRGEREVRVGDKRLRRNFRVGGAGGGEKSLHLTNA